MLILGTRGAPNAKADMVAGCRPPPQEVASTDHGETAHHLLAAETHHTERDIRHAARAAIREG